MTSDGRCEVPDSAFSAHIIKAVTRTLGANLDTAITVARIAAAPAISLFIPVMVSYGRFSETPPVSKVIPLPTKTTCFQFLEPRGA